MSANTKGIKSIRHPLKAHKGYIYARSLRSESAFLLQVPVIRTKTYGERRFDKAAATLWNALPINLRLAKSVDSFKHGLKTHLYRQAFNT